MKISDIGDLDMTGAFPTLFCGLLILIGVNAGLTK